MKQRAAAARGPATWSSASRAPASPPALALRARDEQRDRRRSAARPEGLARRERGCEVHLGAGRGRPRCSGFARVVKSPGVPAERAADRGRARARAPRDRRARAGAGACSPTSSSRHRHQRQDDHDRADRRIYRSAGPGGGRRRQRRHGAAARSRRAPTRSPRPTSPSSARRPRSSSRTPSRSRRDAAVLLNLSPDHLDRHGTFAAYRAAKLRLFARQGERRPRGAAGRRSGRPARARRGALTLRRDAGADLRARRATGGRDAGSRWSRLAASSALRGAHNLENAMAAAAVALARGRAAADACAPGSRPSPGSRTASRRSRASDGVLYVNDSKAHQHREHAGRAARVRRAASVHLILGGRGKGQDFAHAARADRDARPRGLPDRRGRGRPIARRSRGGPGCRARGVRHARTGTRGGARGRRAPARWCCSARRARASTSSRLRGARRASSGELVRERSSVGGICEPRGRTHRWLRLPQSRGPLCRPRSPRSKRPRARLPLEYSACC